MSVERKAGCQVLCLWEGIDQLLYSREILQLSIL